MEWFGFPPIEGGWKCCSGPLIKDFGWLVDRPVGQQADVIDQQVDLLVNEAMLVNRSNQLANRWPVH